MYSPAASKGRPCAWTPVPATCRQAADRLEVRAAKTLLCALTSPPLHLNKRPEHFLGSGSGGLSKDLPTQTAPISFA